MRAALTFALVAGLAACSFGVNRAPATPNVDAPPKCTTSMALPGLDLAVAGAATLGALAADDGGRGVLLGTGALFGLAGTLGAVWVKDCRRKVAAYHPPDVTAIKSAATPEPGSDPQPRDELEPAVELEARVDIAPSSGAAPAACPKGASCPAGLKCDPLRHRCVGAAELGTENQRCAAGVRCDSGLYCDLDRQICLPGDLGLEGGACQPGERCAPGLVCRSGLCVQSATSRGSTRRPKAPRPSRDDEPAPSDRP